jgi:hypothetical protein
VNPHEVSEAVIVSIDSYRAPLRVRAPLGQPASLAKIDADIALLRRSLVVPSLRRISEPEVPRREVWLVAQHDQFAVFFDEADREYGLGILEDDGRIQDINVRGDLVGCFMAR